MPELPRHIPALEGASKGYLGRQGASPGVTLCALPEGLLLLVPGRIGRDELVTAVLHAGLDACSVADAGFEQWLIARDTPASSTSLAGLSKALAGRAHVSDQSHGRVRIALTGPRSLDVLAKGCGMDFTRFAVGAGAMTLFGPVGCHLHRVDAGTFHVTVLRSFARALWDELVGAGLEYGVQAIAP